MPRPRSESFYLKLTPDVSAALSIQTKASLSAIRPPPPPPPPTTLTRPFLKTPPIRTLALPDDADDERDVPRTPLPVLPKRRSNPDLKLGQQPLQIPPTRRPWCPHVPHVPSPLRRDASKPFCPSSLFTTQTSLLPLYPIASASPRPIHSLPLGLSTSGYTLQSGAPTLRQQPRRRTPLYKCTLHNAFFAGPSGSSARRFGVRTAWNIDEDVRRALATAPFPSSFEFSSSEDEEDEDDFPSPCRSSLIEEAIEEAISGFHSCPGKPPAPQARLSSDHSDEDTSSGSDGGEECSSTRLDESSGSEEEELDLQSEEIWEMIPI